MSARAPPPDADESALLGSSSKELVRRSLITGIALILPLAVTLLVLGFVFEFISRRLNPLTSAIKNSQFVATTTGDLLIELVTVLTFVLVVFLLGFVAEFSSHGTRVGDHFDEVMAAIPGVGSVYTSFNEMSEILLDSDTDSFQDVKLVEYPGEGSYTVAFKTAETPSVIEERTDNDAMTTLFLPMAPNPVMGGFVIHVTNDRVVDVDMSVEEGIRSIVTSGVALGDAAADAGGLSASEMRALGRIEHVDQRVSPGGESPDVPDGSAAPSDERVDEYADEVAPEHSDTAQKIAAREREDADRESTETTPAEVSRPDVDAGADAAGDAETAAGDEETADGEPDPESDEAAAAGAGDEVLDPPETDETDAAGDTASRGDERA